MTEGPPVAAWQPGVPLYQHPHYRDSGEGNYVRELFSIHSDEEVSVRIFLNLHGSTLCQVRCPNCLVGWGPEEGSRCWVCNKPSPNYGEALMRSEAAKAAATTVVFRGGPRDGDCIQYEARNHQEIVVPMRPPPLSFYATEEEQPSAVIEVARYLRHHFNHITNCWVFTYDGPAEPPCLKGSPGCTTPGMHEYCETY